MLASRHVVPTSIGPGKTSIDLLKKLRKDFALMAKGSSIEGFPEVTDSISGFDLLVLSETLRSTAIAFLTPEEAEEYNRTFGFGENKNID